MSMNGAGLHLKNELLGFMRVTFDFECTRTTLARIFIAELNALAWEETETDDGMRMST